MDIINEFKEALSDNLLSIIKFGAEGRPENTLIVVKEIEFEELDKVKLVIRNCSKDNIVPIIFTKDELISSSDVFPLELLDIVYPHEVLYGKDVLKEVKFDKKNVRKQVEFELRSKLIHLRENYLMLRDDKDFRELLKSAVPTLMPLFYGLIFLKGKKIPEELSSLFNGVEKAYKVDLRVFKDIKENKIKNEAIDIKRLMNLLYELIDIIDNM